MNVVTAYGVVAKCREPVHPADVERVLVELAQGAIAGAEVVVDEATDRGSLVSARAERFAFFTVSGHNRVFCFCRVRHFKGGFEAVFNPSDSGLSAREVYRTLVDRLSVELVRREML